MFFRTIGFFVLVAWVSFAVGCQGDKGTKTVDVSGAVSLDGKPVANVVVNFHTEKHFGNGVTNAEGKYSLVQGAEPGQNKVYFTKVPEGSAKADANAGMDSGQMEAAASARGAAAAADLKRSLAGGLPEQYSDPEKSPITFQVPESGTTNADFKLTSK